MRPDPGVEVDGVDLAALAERARARRQARARTLQLVEWFGFALIVFGVELLFGVGWAVLAAGVALVVSANAS